MIAVGIDVGDINKGFHIALIKGELVCTFHSVVIQELIAICKDADIIAIDAPCGWAIKKYSTTGKSRQSEREMKKNRNIQSFYTPTRTIALSNGKKYYDWMFNGEKLWNSLRSHFKGHATALIETFPHGIACSLSGRILKASNKRMDRSELLKELGYRFDKKHSIDLVDSILCAHMGKLYLAKNYEMYGNQDEGQIVLPAWKHTE
jgi:predicted nuclease with RNAse H fold